MVEPQKLQETFVDLIKHPQNNLFLSIDLKDDDLSFIEEKLAKVFPWHFNDTKRSLLTDKIINPKLEFSYYLRLHSHFNGIDLLDNMVSKYGTTKSFTSLWDSSVDNSAEGRVPCLSVMSLISEPDGSCSMFVLFRSRDLVKRMPFNWFFIDKLHKELCQKLNVKQGILYDYSVFAFAKQEDVQKALDSFK